MKKIIFVLVIIYVTATVGLSDESMGLPGDYVFYKKCQNGFNLYKDISGAAIWPHVMAQFFYKNGKLTGVSAVPWTDKAVTDYPHALYPGIPPGYAEVSGVDCNGFTQYIINNSVSGYVWHKINVKPIEINGKIYNMLVFGVKE